MPKENEKVIMSGPGTGWSIVVPNYNGEKVIGPCIESLIQAKNKARGNGEIIIVDDGSSDNSISILESYKNNIHLITFNENKGFSSACNAGILKAEGDVVFLFNNDVQIDPGIIDRALPHFSETDLFAVSFHAVDDTGEIRIGRVVPVFKKGFLKGRPGESESTGAKSEISFFASGGGSAFARNKFLSLGGFDELFNPFYWEDTDLSYRAWKRGWKIIYDPRCRLLHPSHGVIQSLFANKLLDRISRRNQLVFFWKNVDDKLLWASHLIFLFIKLMSSVLTLRFDYIKAFLGAFRLWGAIRRFRKDEKKYRARTDREILLIFSNTRD